MLGFSGVEDFRAEGSRLIWGVWDADFGASGALLVEAFREF